MTPVSPFVMVATSLRSAFLFIAMFYWKVTNLYGPVIRLSETIWTRLGNRSAAWYDSTYLFITEPINKACLKFCTVSILAFQL